MRKLRFFFPAVLFAGTLFSQLPDSAAANIRTGDPVPPFHAEVAQSPERQSWDLDSLRGRVVVFNFNDLYCPQDSYANLPNSDDAVLVWVTNNGVWLAQKRLARFSRPGWVLAEKKGEIRKALGLEHAGANLVYLAPSGAIAGYSNDMLPNTQVIRNIYVGNTSKLSQTPKSFQYWHLEPAALPRPYYQAEIKQHTGDRVSRIIDNPGSLSMDDVELQRMIAEIWQVRLDQIEIPKDLQSGTYDFTLTVPEEDEKQLQTLAKQAVEAHFGINVAEVRQTDDLYVLTAQRREAAGLHFVKASCHSSQTAIGTEFTGQCVSMDAVAATLSDFLKRSVINETNLQGNYDIAVTWKSTEAADVIAGLEQAGLSVQKRARPSVKLIVQH